jgi:hypothetical protein
MKRKFKIAPYTKAIVAGLTALVTWSGAVVASNSGPITSGEWQALAVAAVGVVGVYALPNKTS